MASHSHRYHHSCFPRFGNVGWNPTWCKCANHATTLWLRLQNLANCIPCPWHTYMRCLTTFSGCGWVNGFTFTLLPPQTLPQICEDWLKSNFICKCANHATTRLQNLLNCIPCPWHTYMRCLSTFSGCGWAYGFTLTQSPYCPPILYLLILSRCKFGGMIIFPANITLTHFPSRKSRFYVGGKRYCKYFLMFALVYVQNEMFLVPT
jgi:hypothetical protein